MADTWHIMSNDDDCCSFIGFTGCSSKISFLLSIPIILAAGSLKILACYSIRAVNVTGIQCCGVSYYQVLALCLYTSILKVVE